MVVSCHVDVECGFSRQRPGNKHTIVHDRDHNGHYDPSVARIPDVNTAVFPLGYEQRTHHLPAGTRIITEGPFIRLALARGQPGGAGGSGVGVARPRACATRPPRDRGPAEPPARQVRPRVASARTWSFAPPLPACPGLRASDRSARASPSRSRTPPRTVPGQRPGGDRRARPRPFVGARTFSAYFSLENRKATAAQTRGESPSAKEQRESREPSAVSGTDGEKVDRTPADEHAPPPRRSTAGRARPTHRDA